MFIEICATMYNVNVERVENYFLFMLTGNLIRLMDGVGKYWMKNGLHSQRLIPILIDQSIFYFLYTQASCWYYTGT